MFLGTALRRLSARGGPHHHPAAIPARAGAGAHGYGGQCR